MPDYYIDIPHALGIRFVPVDPVYDPRYNTKHFDDFWFSEQLRDYEQPSDYYHKIQNNDVIKLQVKSTVGQPQISVYNCEQKEVVAPMPMTVKPTSVIGQPYLVYEITLDFATINGGNPLPEDHYWLYMQAGSSPTAKAISEGIWVKDKHVNTVLFEYSHRENDYDVLWETGIDMQMRVDGVIRPIDMEFKRKKSSFEDQTQNLRLTSSTPYEEYKLIIADANGTGVAPWVPKKLIYILGFSSVKIDGKPFVCDDDGFEKQTVNGYPKAAYTINMREGENNYSKRVFGGGSSQVISITYGIRTKLFGSLNAPPSTLNVVITDSN